MSTELWQSLGHYFVGVIIVMALLVGLMEASRKYDRFRDTAHLLMAIGYFLLIIWGLLDAVGLMAASVSVLGFVCQFAGFSLLVAGYYLRHTLPVEAEPLKSASAKPTVPSEPVKSEPVIIETPAEVKEGKEADPAADQPAQPSTQEWLALLSADEPIEDKVAQAESTKEPAAASTDTITGTTVDLSYLAHRSRRRGLHHPHLEKSAKASLPAKESRAAIMDELFPIEKGKAVAKKTDQVEDPAEEGVSEGKVSEEKISKVKKQPKKAKKTKVTKSLAPAAFLLPALTNNLTTILPDSLLLIPLLVLVGVLIGRRKQQETGMLAVGFTFVLLAKFISLLSDPSLNTEWAPESLVASSSLMAWVLQLLGYLLVGWASWLNIRGKVTRHFLTIVVSTYALLLVLTVGIARLIITDDLGLRLLLILMTGVLITVLPIMHALIYHHPSQPKAEPES